MEYVRLGETGLKVSRICLGCMSFGTGDDWRVDGDAAKRVLNRAWDLGVNFYDTANVYSGGRSEEIVGEFLQGRRDDAVLATKVRREMGPGPNQRGLSRAHIMWQVRESLRRLKTDHIDLYQIHRWDNETPIEETLSTMTDLVGEGKVRYIGASSMWAWQFAKALYTSDMKGFARFVSMQDLYNLLYREEERDMIPLCEAEGSDSSRTAPPPGASCRGSTLTMGRWSPGRGTASGSAPAPWATSATSGSPRTTQL